MECIPVLGVNSWKILFGARGRLIVSDSQINLIAQSTYHNFEFAADGNEALRGSAS